MSKDTNGVKKWNKQASAKRRRLVVIKKLESQLISRTKNLNYLKKVKLKAALEEKDVSRITKELETLKLRI
tara:strand:- start:1360 stop:1572 length:213 start_codon:yes stop_codon:yes gene_type:complete